VARSTGGKRHSAALHPGIAGTGRSRASVVARCADAGAWASGPAGRRPGSRERNHSGSEGLKLAGIGRVVLVVAAVFVAVWLCVILYWRASGATPGGTQMLLLLGVLPVALLGGIWLVRRARASRAEPA